MLDIEDYAFGYSSLDEDEPIDDEITLDTAWWDDEYAFEDDGFFSWLT